MSATNLLQETLTALSGAKKTARDVRWVGKSDGTKILTWEKFATLISELVYTSGFGGNALQLDLVVVGDDWWLERGEYDGSEWWEFKTLPIKSSKFDVLRMEDVLNEY